MFRAPPWWLILGVGLTAMAMQVWENCRLSEANAQLNLAIDRMMEAESARQGKGTALATECVAQLHRCTGLLNEWQAAAETCAAGGHHAD